MPLMRSWAQGAGAKGASKGKMLALAAAWMLGKGVAGKGRPQSQDRHPRASRLVCVQESVGGTPPGAEQKVRSECARLCFCQDEKAVPGTSGDGPKKAKKRQVEVKSEPVENVPPLKRSNAKSNLERKPSIDELFEQFEAEGSFWDKSGQWHPWYPEEEEESWTTSGGGVGG